MDPMEATDDYKPADMEAGPEGESTCAMEAAAAEAQVSEPQTFNIYRQTIRDQRNRYFQQQFKAITIQLVFLLLIYQGCCHFGATSTNHYTQMEFVFNKFVFEIFIIMLTSNVITMVLRYESVGRQGCINKTRKFLFIVIRLCCLAVQAVGFYIYVTEVIP